MEGLCPMLTRDSQMQAYCLEIGQPAVPQVPPTKIMTEKRIYTIQAQMGYASQKLAGFWRIQPVKVTIKAVSSMNMMYLAVKHLAFLRKIKHKSNCTTYKSLPDYQLVFQSCVVCKYTHRYKSILLSLLSHISTNVPTQSRPNCRNKPNSSASAENNDQD